MNLKVLRLYSTLEVSILKRVNPRNLRGKMNFWKSMLWIMVLLVSGCATAPNIKLEDPATFFKIPENHAYIYLYREKTFDSGLAGIIGTIGHNNVSIDNKHSLSINNAEYYIVEVTPGEHIIRWSTVLMGYETDIEGVYISLKAGEWAQVNFSDMDTKQPISDTNLQRKLHPLQFMGHIDLTK